MQGEYTACMRETQISNLFIKYSAASKPFQDRLIY